MKKIDLMTGQKYIKDNNHIKLIIINPNGDMYLASNQYDNLSMIKDFNIKVPMIYDTCKTHAHYIQVLLHKYFINNPNYQHIINNKDIFDAIIDTTNQLLKDGFIVFYNITNYNERTNNNQKNTQTGILNINYYKVTKEQKERLLELEKELKDFTTINVPEYLDPIIGYNDNYIKPNQLYETIFGKKRKTR